jgi:hypothetical protein
VAYAPRPMARILKRLPEPPSTPDDRCRAPSAGTNRAGWNLATSDLQRAALRALRSGRGTEPNGNAAGIERAAITVGDVMRYAQSAHGLTLTIEQARGVLDRCGWLTYSPMEWIDRLIAAAAKREEIEPTDLFDFPPRGVEIVAPD